MKKIILLACVYISFVSAFAVTSPVVQVVSYKEPLGLYFSLQGWGSGSIVDHQGHIITNNHVVDDGVGGISDDFAICMTDNPSLPPRCHYTASVITRDPDSDIAVLQLDSVDIFGKAVNFSALSTLSMDMEYVPQSGDSVVARGYPWVGANTITETQGIVSGTAQYNGNIYIKTDTLIAGGNSGGPLVYDGKMIGVNTFLIGGGYDPSLGYSLLIGEAQELIRVAFSETKKIQSNSPTFAGFLQKIDAFSTQQKITDPLVTFRFTEKYNVDSYIPSMSLQASLTNGSPTSVTNFGFYHMSTPRILDGKGLKSYISRQFSLGDGDGEGFELRPVSIGGQSFYEVIDTLDPDNSATKSDYGYVTMLDETHMMILFFSTPSPTKNTKEKIQKTVQDFLGNISFPAKFTFPEIKSITIPGADIILNVRKHSSISYDFAEYAGLLSYSIKNKQDFVMMRDYLGNFWSKAQIAIFRNSFETQEDTIDTWMKNTLDVSYKKTLVQKKITYQGHQGFLACFPDYVTDESTKEDQDIIRCEAVFLINDTHDYLVSAQMILPEKQLKVIDMLMAQYIKRTVQIPENGETNFGTNANAVTLPYTDIGNQSQAFQEALKTLISYGILQNRPVFEGDMPLRWREYFSIYVWAVYHKKMTDVIDGENPKSLTFEKALSVLPVSGNDYAEDDEWKLGKINNIIRLLVAGGSLPDYTLDTVYDFSESEYASEGRYKNDWDSIIAFEKRYFSHRIAMQSVEYIPEKIVTYNPFTDLTIQPKNSIDVVSFFRDNAKDKDEVSKMIQCQRTSITYFSTECREMRKESLVDSLTYPVLTKGKAIENILGYIDESLWDATLHSDKT